jgi:hypothetical protein
MTAPFSLTACKYNRMLLLLQYLKDCAGCKSNALMLQICCKCYKIALDDSIEKGENGPIQRPSRLACCVQCTNVHVAPVHMHGRKVVFKNAFNGSHEPQQEAFCGDGE